MVTTASEKSGDGGPEDAWTKGIARYTSERPRIPHFLQIGVGQYIRGNVPLNSRDRRGYFRHSLEFSGLQGKENDEKRGRQKIYQDATLSKECMTSC
jgi:hypothetical protein